MDLILVPFLLAAHLPPNKENLRLYPETKFNVHVNSTFLIENGNTTNSIRSNFTCKFMCNSTTRDKLSCYIKNPGLIVTSRIESNINLIKEILEETTVNIPFDYIKSMPIEMVFDYYGIEEYNVPNNAHPSSYFLGLFRAIANQMNIGCNIVRDMKTFQVWEGSQVGICSTQYTIDDKMEISYLISPSNKFILQSISDFELERNRIKVIKKRRYMHTCQDSNNYMFGIKHANTSFPVYHKIIQSTSLMQISTDQFSSETENKYKLYNQDKKQIGMATEYIYFDLDAIEHVRSRNYY